MDYAAVINNWKMFEPRDYLHEYYADIGRENFALLQFAVRAFRSIPPDGILLDFGGGPTIYPLIAAADRVREIHFCDYLDKNISEVRRWLQGDPSAFNWREFVKATLELESNSDHTQQAISQRESLVRQRVTRLFSNCSKSPGNSGLRTLSRSANQAGQWRNLMLLADPVLQIVPTGNAQLLARFL